MLCIRGILILRIGLCWVVLPSGGLSFANCAVTYQWGSPALCRQGQGATLPPLLPPSSV